MKIYRNNRAKKMLVRFDNELRDLLLNDLMQFTFKKADLIGNTQVMTTSTLSVA